METKSESGSRIIGYKKEETYTASSISEDIVRKISGNYIGSGESPAGNSFVNKIIKISRVGDRRVKIEPVGHADIAAFEINIMQISMVITQDDNEANDLEVNMRTAPHRIKFETYIPDQTFEGCNND